MQGTIFGWQQNVPDLNKYKQFAGLTRLCFVLFDDGYHGNDLTFVQQEHLPPTLRHLDLSDNKLTEVPDFSQCVNLQVLNLKNNNLSVGQLGHLPPSLRHLDLSDNELTEVPDFSQCVSLQVLNLKNNNLSAVELEHLSLSLRRLGLSKNKLTEVPDFSQYVQLQELYLGNNNLSVVNLELLPPRLTRLNLSENELAVLQDFSKHKILKYLNLSNNNSLHTIHGLPESIEDFSCSHSPVEFIKKTAFHENTYELLRSKISGKSLKQPPYGVYIQGLDAVLDFFTETSVEITQSR